MRIFNFERAAIVFVSLVLVFLPYLSGQSEETAATKRLKARSGEFRKEVIQVSDGVYSAIGWNASVNSMIVGETGAIIIDPGQAVPWSQQVLEEFRKITDKPVKAIIYTHSHGDHVNGAKAFEGEKDLQVWARSNFGSEGRSVPPTVLAGARPVGAAGMELPPEKRINNGIAPALYPRGRPQDGGAPLSTQGQVSAPQSTRRVMGAVGPGALAPTHTFTEDRKVLDLAGIRVELVAAPGETEDTLYVWLPEKRVLFAGDNFYKSFPNVYPLRGVERSAEDWAASVEKMLAEEPEVLVGGHTRPIMGKEAVKQVLTDYRDAIRFVVDKTLEGMQEGLTPNELVDFVKLPHRLAEKDYLADYYGAVAFTVRAIYAQNVGWFDGRATSIFPLNPAEEARKMAELAGGEVALLNQARKALSAGDYQWAAQICNHLIALNREAAEPKLLQAEALENLAEKTFNAPSRNYYFAYAQMLREEAKGK